MGKSGKPQRTEKEEAATVEPDEHGTASDDEETSETAPTLDLTDKPPSRRFYANLADL